MGLNIDKAYVGSSEVDKIYLGSELVWQALEPGIPVEGAPNGVYILHTNGTLYTSDQWKTSYNQDAVGVALITDNCKFVIAPEESPDGILWSSVREEVKGCTSTTSSSESKKDYKGLQNTDAIIEKYGNSIDYAAGWCRNYTFKNGAKGYLGALGEWYDAYNNKDEIESYLSIIGGITLNNASSPEAGYWSSTQYDDTIAYVVKFKYNSFVTYFKDKYYLHVRPIAPLT